MRIVNKINKKRFLRQFLFKKKFFAKKLPNSQFSFLNSPFKSVFCLLLCLFLTLSACSSLGGTSSHSKDGKPAEESAADGHPRDAAYWVDRLDTLDGRYSGRVFSIVTTSRDFFDSDPDTLLGMAVSDRNTLVSQKFGVGFEITESDSATIKSRLRAANKSGSPYADLICAPALVLAELAAEGLLENLYSMPYMDFSAGYMPKRDIEAQTAAGSLYFLSSPLTFSAKDCIAVFYDKGLADKADLNLIRMVHEGLWSWDRLYGSAAAAKEAGAGYGIGSLLPGGELAEAVYLSSGNSLISAGRDVNPSVSYNESSAELTENVLNKIFSSGGFYTEASGDAAIRAFSNGNIAFLIGKAETAAFLDGSKREWGMLPLPKHSEGQSGYFSPVSPSAAAVAVPRGSSDSAFAGCILNALFASTLDLPETVLKTTYMNRSFWSNNTSVMLFLIAGSKKYDLGSLYSSVPAVSAIGADRLVQGAASAPPEKSALDAFNAFSNKVFK